MALLLATPGTAAYAQQSGPETTMLTGTVTGNWIWEPGEGAPSSPVTQAPELVTSRFPAHTVAAVRAGTSGHVIIEATIDAQGIVVAPRPIRSLDDYDLNRGALQALEAWRFRPAMRDGRPVPVTSIFTFSFEITAQEAESALRRTAVRMGTPGLVPPRMISMELPEYTPRAAEAGIEGDVYIEAVVTADGGVAEPKLVRGLADDELNRRALDAITQWEFEPGIRDDQPVPVLALFTVAFRNR